jgi:hypothetical protein
MKRKVLGKDPDGGSKKRKEVGNDNSLASMFAKQQAVSALNKASGMKCCGASRIKWRWTAGQFLFFFIRDFLV